MRCKGKKRETDIYINWTTYISSHREGEAVLRLERLEAYIPQLGVTVDEYEIRGNFSHVRGRVTNNGARTVSCWKLTLRYFDKAESVIDTTFTNSAENLGPGETKRFDRSSQHAPGAKRVTATMEEVRLAP